MALVTRQLPDTIDEIENAILENTAKADANYNTNPSVIEQYEKRKKEVFLLCCC